MSEENVNVTVSQDNQCQCFCKSKGFRKFLTIALGSFVGVYCALSLFCALHKPPMPMHPVGGFYGHHHMIKHHGGDCPCKKHMKKFIKEQKEFKADFEKKAEDKD